jgi:hypothetical protein
MQYAVAIFSQYDDGFKIEQSLFQSIVSAKNEDEALGIVVNNDQRPFKDFPIVYYVVSKIEPEKTEIPKSWVNTKNANDSGYEDGLRDASGFVKGGVFNEEA